MIDISDSFNQPIFRLRVASSALAGLAATADHSEIQRKDLEPIRVFIEDIEANVQEIQDAVDALLGGAQDGAR